MVSITRSLLTGVIVLLATITTPAVAQDLAATTEETILLIRHGEKPKKGLGQLSCQGLNRALALPAVIEKKFGKPDVIYAPNPAHQHIDKHHAYDYVRPLATIEPTAIQFGLPVNTQLGLEQITELRQQLSQPVKPNALILVAWEHKLLVQLVKNIIADYRGDVAVVPAWGKEDFDSIYVLKIKRTAGQVATVSFSQDYQGLNGLSTNCGTHL